jgi:hypothetical protein
MNHVNYLSFFTKSAKTNSFAAHRTYIFVLRVSSSGKIFSQPGLSASDLPYTDYRPQVARRNNIHPAAVTDSLCRFSGAVADNK